MYSLKLLSTKIFMYFMVLGPTKTDPQKLANLLHVYIGNYAYALRVAHLWNIFPKLLLIPNKIILCLKILGYTVYHMWPDLRKAAFHAHNGKTHFSPSHNSCTCWLTIQPGIDAQSCPGCFCCGLFLRLIRRSQVYGSPSNGCISPWQADSWL